MRALADFIGALIATALLNRLSLLALWRWRGGYLRLLIANAASLAILVWWGSYNPFDDGSFRLIPAWPSMRRRSLSG
jgi:hypothetical protein